jgi:glyoxylase-like metal-dependent hydrolase (beta-lactamase superfamily II)
MKIDQVILGAYETNCYILRESERATDCLIIDPGLEAHLLIDFLRQHELNPVVVVLTHGHIDHMAGVVALRENFPKVKLCIHKHDAEMLTGDAGNLAILMGRHFNTEPAELHVEDGGMIEQAGVKLEVLHTPGHTPGGICLYSPGEGIVFTDDTLFADSIGRTDFQDGNAEQLIKGIREKLFTLPDETKVYPGHGPLTTIADEKAHNPFFK